MNHTEGLRSRIKSKIIFHNAFHYLYQLKLKYCLFCHRSYLHFHKRKANKYKTLKVLILQRQPKIPKI